MSESVCAIFFSFLSVGISFCVCYVNRRSLGVFDFFRSSFFASFLSRFCYLEMLTICSGGEIYVRENGWKFF